MMIADGQVDGTTNPGKKLESSIAGTAVAASERLEEALHQRQQDKKDEKTDQKNEDGDQVQGKEKKTQTAKSNQREDPERQAGMKRPAASSRPAFMKKPAAASSSTSPKAKDNPKPKPKPAPKKQDQRNSKGPITRQMRLKKKTSGLQQVPLREGVLWLLLVAERL